MCIIKVMSVFIRRIAFFSVLFSLFFAAFPVFSQTEVREQGLITVEPFWRQALGGEILSLPHVQAQSAVVALDGGNIKAYSMSGTPMWNYSARGKISSFVTRSPEGTSYISRLNGTLIAVNRIGRELWRRNIENPFCAKPVIGWDGRLFVPVENKILCFTASGNLLWSKTYESSIIIPPRLDRNGGILFSLEREAYRIDPFGNTQTWPFSVPPAFIFLNDQQQVMALFTNGKIELLGANQDWFIGAQSNVHPDLLPMLPATPLAAAERRNSIAAVMRDGRVSLVSLSEGKILWTGISHIRENRAGSQDTEAEVLFDERGIYVLSRSGATCFSPEGRRFWFTYLHNTAAIPAFGDDGVLYSGGKDWILYAYKMEDRILQQKVLYGNSPDGSYGLGRPQFAYVPNVPLYENELRNQLDKIASAVSMGDVGANEPAWTTFLLNLSVSQDKMIYRIAAINLLGKLGSRDTISWLISIFNRSAEPSIKVAAVNAIGEIGVDPEGNALQTFIFSIIQGGLKDEQILTAIASATGALCRFSGPPLGEMGIRILSLLAANSQPPLVRRQAERELASLR